MLVIALLMIVFVRKVRYAKSQSIELRALARELFDVDNSKSYDPNVPIENRIDTLPYDIKCEMTMDKVTLGKVTNCPKNLIDF